MKIYKFAAVLALSSVLLGAGSASAADPLVKPHDLQKCSNKIAQIKKEATRLEREFYGKTRPAGYDGGLQESYNHKLREWNKRRDNYASYVSKTNKSQHPVNLGPVDAALSVYIGKTEALENTYINYIAKFSNVGPDNCTDIERAKTLDALKKEIKPAKTAIHAQRKTVTVAGQKVTQSLNTAKKQRNTLIKKKQIVKG